MKFGLFIYVLVVLINQTAVAKISVIDDSGYAVAMQIPATRIISLAPHITELVYAAGASQQVIAAVDFSDYPAAAKKLPRVGSGYLLDIEAIISLKPDLIIGWGSGNQLAQLQQLKKLGFNVYISEPVSLDGIAKNINDFGLLLGNEIQAALRANNFKDSINQLREKHLTDKKVKVFYQVWNQPLFTVNGEHLISHIIELCGGENIFSELSVMSPQINVESVMARNPDVIIAGVGEGRTDWLAEWKKWPAIRAVEQRQVYGIDADLIVRHTPRILQGAELMCEYLQRARDNL